MVFCLVFFFHFVYSDLFLFFFFFFVTSCLCIFKRNLLQWIHAKHINIAVFVYFVYYTEYDLISKSTGKVNYGSIEVKFLTVNVKIGTCFTGEVEQLYKDSWWFWNSWEYVLVDQVKGYNILKRFLNLTHWKFMIETKVKKWPKRNINRNNFKGVWRMFKYNLNYK